MIEVMVAMIIIAIVAIGTTQLAIVARRAEYDVQLNRTALMFLDDLASRMKANRQESTYNNGANYTTTIPTTIPSPSCIGLNYTACTPAQMAAYDLWDWGQTVSSLLPRPASGSIANIVCTSKSTNALPPSFTITIYWTGSANSPQEASLSFSTPFN